MALIPGTRLGPYEIAALIGEGGMGQVYRATDTRLNRAVAVKVLSPTLADDPQFRARFDREAQAIASLTHPGICTLHDIGHEHDVDFLVLEYLEGETLAARLERGALPFDQALACAIQIADALDAAHRRGILHRDLKPGNIFLVKSASASAPPTAKLLDFGLAKPAAPAVAGPGPSHVPTTPPALTAQGMILGTFQYMAPEQLEGQEADARTDLFAFGATVYEMFTGEKAFEGKSQASLIGAIMHANPKPIVTFHPLAPPLLDRVIGRCLEKDPNERWQSAGDLKSQLKWVAEVPPPRPEPRSGLRARREIAAWTLATVLALAAAVLVLRARLAEQPTENQPVVRAAVIPPDGWYINRAHQPDRLAVSPDGQRLAFVAAGPNRRRKIWIRPLDGATAVPLAGTDDGLSPFWSPDSQSIGFFAAEKLKRVDASGGPVLTVCDNPGEKPGDIGSKVRGGTWNQSGVMLFSAANELGEGGNRIYRVEAGKPVHIADGQIPFFLPDGTHFLYRRQGGIYLGRLGSGERRLLVEGLVSQPMYAQGHLVYVREQTLLAQRFEPVDSISGQPVTLAGPVSTGFGGLSAFSVSSAGVTAYEEAEADGAPSRLRWFDRTGKELGAIGDEANYRGIEISSTGNRLVAAIMAPGSITSDLWLFDLSRGLPARFTSGPEHESTAVWSPDDERIVYGRSRPDPGLYEKPSNLIGEAKLLADRGEAKAVEVMSWSHDGRFLLYNGAYRSIWVAPLHGDGKPVAFMQDVSGGLMAQFSPDAHWIAYHSRESGQLEVYIAPFPGMPGRKVKVSTDGGGWPRWRRDGKELYFLSNEQIMAAEIRTDGGELRSGIPSTLFETRPKNLEQGWPYDVSPDGRFLVNVMSGTTSPPITLLVGWPALLRKQLGER